MEYDNGTYTKMCIEPCVIKNDQFCGKLFSVIERKQLDTPLACRPLFITLPSKFKAS